MDRPENEKWEDVVLLTEMLEDDYYPNFLVAKLQKILWDLCISIEEEEPADETALFVLTHAATERINDLVEEFYENDSDIETVAREALAEEFIRIVDVYGFEDVDIEEVIAPRDW